MVTNNPYKPPVESRESDSRLANGLPVLVLWIVLAGGVWFGRSQLLPIYHDFELVLPPVTTLVAHRFAPPFLLLIGAAFYFAVTKTENLKRRWLNNVSIMTALGFSAVAAYSFFRPFVVLVSDLG